jgi:hypothetical protein
LVSEAPIYERIGVGYRGTRRPDPRIERRLHEALGDAALILNVGAGTGSYEPTDRRVVGVEPSAVMIRQRATDAAATVRGVAEHLPFADATFDGAMALLTVHHWVDPIAGLAEVRRVTAGPIVVFTFDMAVHLEQWLITDYLPEMAVLDANVPTPAEIAKALGGGTVEVIAVPHDCVDGFCHAWWRRPHAYLEPEVRAGISGIARLPDAIVDRAMARLADDLETGEWQRAHADLLALDEIDAGYRIVIA